MPRTKGTPNKLTTDVKEFLAEIVKGEQECIKSALSELFKEDKFKYLQIMSKLLAFVVPKAKEEHSITINRPTHRPTWFDEVSPTQESAKDEY